MQPDREPVRAQQQEPPAEPSPSTPPPTLDNDPQSLKERNHKVMRERKVPSTPLQRVMGFSGLAAGLVLGTMQESAKRALGFTEPPPPPSSSSSSSPKAYSVVLSEKNAERIAEALCRMRGAALKIGQMLSIQDENVIPPQVQAALERVRQGADIMPQYQLEGQLKKELGEDWRSRFKEFDFSPMAAASIGQVRGVFPLSLYLLSAVPRPIHPLP